MGGLDGAAILRSASFVLHSLLALEPLVRSLRCSEQPQTDGDGGGSRSLSAGRIRGIVDGELDSKGRPSRVGLSRTAPTPALGTFRRADGLVPDEMGMSGL